MPYFGFYFLLAGHRCVARVAASDSVCARDQLMTKFADATEVELLESGGDEQKLKMALKRSEECPKQEKKIAEAPQPQLTIPDPPKPVVPVKNLWIPRL